MDPRDGALLWGCVGLVDLSSPTFWTSGLSTSRVTKKCHQTPLLQKAALRLCPSFLLPCGLGFGGLGLPVRVAPGDSTEPQLPYASCSEAEGPSLQPHHPPGPRPAHPLQTSQLSSLRI